MRAFYLFAVLFFGWLVMSGIYNPLLISLGLISCAVCVWLGSKIGALDYEGFPTHLFKRLPSYLGWLLQEIFWSNISTAKIILSSKHDPEIFEIPANQKTSAGLATYANSITLTPGTVTVDLVESKVGPSRFTIHALHADFGNELREGEMDRRNVYLEKQPQKNQLEKV